MPNEQIDGMDLMNVREKAAEVLEKVRSGEGPFLLEVMTYRYRGHSMGDPEKYREKEEVKKWEDEDPIGVFRNYLLDQEIATEKELDSQDDEAEEIIDEAVQFAESSPNPEPEALFEDIYAEPTPVEYRGYDMAHESEGN
jgi:pyruvate dehydrogenase E1 component alpha subunit